MKVSTWSNARRQIKKDFERAEITRCELCNAAFPLSFAHRLKRRKITTLDELNVCALLCVPCHSQIEFLPADEMYRIVTDLVEKRNDF